MPFSFADAAQPIALQAVVGLAVGAMLGMILRLLTKRPLGGALVTGILGAVGFVGGAVGTALVPWRLNTVTYRMGDTIVTTTTKRYPHPYQIAFVLAVFLALLWEAFSMNRDHRASTRTSGRTAGRSL
jgi:hypothetical protein